MAVRINLHTIPMGRDALKVKVQIELRPGHVDTFGKLHIPKSVYQKIEKALSTEFEVTHSGEMERREK
jgi:hypothetical protein